jgi:hypothetical protein
VNEAANIQADQSSLSSICMSVLRLFAIVLGSLAVVVVPVQGLADIRRASNEASADIPNMEPGVVVMLAIVVAAPIVIAVLLIELTRSWGFSQTPLSIPSCIALGALAAWPVGCSFSSSDVHLGYPLLLLASTVSVIAFYAIRWAWLVRLNANLKRSGSET